MTEKEKEKENEPLKNQAKRILKSQRKVVNSELLTLLTQKEFGAAYEKMKEEQSLGELSMHLEYNV